MVRHRASPHARRGEACNARRTPPLVLRYEKPAATWVEALPLGNGSMGAMVFGPPEVARCQFTEDTLGVGEPHDYAHAGGKERLSAIRGLLSAGRQREAEALSMREFLSVPLPHVAYQPCGDLRGIAHGGMVRFEAWLEARVRSLLRRPAVVRWGERTVTLETERGGSYDLAAKLAGGAP